MKKNENTTKMKNAVIFPIMHELDYQKWAVTQKGQTFEAYTSPPPGNPFRSAGPYTMNKELLDDISENLSVLFKREMRTTKNKQSLSVAKTLHDRLAMASSVVGDNPLDEGVMERISQHMSKIPYTQRTMERMVEESRRAKKSKASRKKRKKKTRKKKQK